MADERDTQDGGQSAQQPGGRIDESSPVQRELAREERERAAVGDDVAENRNLSGSTTWETLAEQASQGGRDQQRDQEGGQQSGQQRAQRDPGLTSEG